MSGIDQASIRNSLLSALSMDSFSRLYLHLDRIDLPLRMDPVAKDELTQHVYFIENGLASIVAESEDDQQIEVGHIGWEGMSGFHVALDDDQTANRTFMQVADSGLRLPVLI